MHLLFPVVFARNDERRDFHMRHFYRNDNAAADTVQIALQLMIPVSAKAFEIDIDRIDVRQQRLPRLCFDRAVGDEHIA